MKKAFNALLLSTAITATAAQAEPVNLRETLAQEFGTAVEGTTSIDHLQVEKKDGVLWIKKPDPSIRTQNKPEERDEANNVFFEIERTTLLDSFVSDLGGLAIHIESKPDRIQRGVDYAKNLAEAIESDTRYIELAQATGVKPDVQIIAYASDTFEAQQGKLTLDGIILGEGDLQNGFNVSDVVDLYALSLETSNHISTEKSCSIAPRLLHCN